MYMSKSASITRFRMGRKEKRGGCNAVCGRSGIWDEAGFARVSGVAAHAVAEFLLVDDASPDGAGALMADHPRRDSRFRVLTHSQNRGLFAARMTGADAATGKYLAFLDSDDFVSVDFYRAAVALAEENDFDLVMGDTVWQRENGDRFVRPVHADCVLEDELRGNAVRDAVFQQAMTCYSFHTMWL